MSLRERLTALADSEVAYDTPQAVALAAARMALETAAQECQNEHVDADATQEESDRAYNMACDDCARAIGALAEELK